MRLFLLFWLSLCLAAFAQDHSEHQVRMIEVEPGVTLEVLDWGGSGEPIVLLTGLGDNAHVFDDFAYQFRDDHRVLGITRRGWGSSSHPSTGYDVATRTRDDLAVLDALGIERAIFIGHSIAGDELSDLGADHPERVSKLVYLDAGEYGEHSKLPQPPAPDYEDRDIVSFQAFMAATARLYGVREPEAAVRGAFTFDPTGQVVGPSSLPEATELLKAGSKQADYEHIRAPVLALMVPLGEQPGYAYLSPEARAQFDRDYPPLVAWQQRMFARMRSGIKNLRFLELPNSYHYIFINNEALVVREIRKFLAGD